jgi:putative heme-binding domain-containing protein
LVALAADPGTRFEAVEALAQMPETAALELFLEGLASKNSDLRAACRKAIGALGREALPVIETRAAGLSPAVLGELQRIFTKDDRARRGPLFTTQVKVLEATDYFDFALKESGDAGRGREIFADASGVACVRCHRAGQDGGDTGPDLSGIGAQFDKRALAESILFPSKAVREGYQQVEIETNDNETVYGLVRTEDNESLVIRDASGAARQIAKTEIKSRRNSELSLMPEGLQAGLSLQEFADLVEYLASLKGRQ